MGTTNPRTYAALRKEFQSVVGEGVNAFAAREGLEPITERKLNQMAMPFEEMTDQVLWHGLNVWPEEDEAENGPSNGRGTGQRLAVKPQLRGPLRFKSYALALRRVAGAVAAMAILMSVPAVPAFAGAIHKCCHLYAFAAVDSSTGVTDVADND